MPAKEGELAVYHTRAYIQALKKPPRSREDLEEVGLIDDCPPIHNLFEFAALEAGGSLQAVDMRNAPSKQQIYCIVSISCTPSH